MSLEQPMTDPVFKIEAVDDPVQAAPVRAQIERGWRNADWLAAHWADLLPQARGRFVAVAGQQAYLADSAEEAWSWAKAAHPEDDGAIVQYVRREQGPRIYAHRGPVVQVR
jgi:hypothetical protein